jgi:hypothetical protein
LLQFLFVRCPVKGKLLHSVAHSPASSRPLSSPAGGETQSADHARNAESKQKSPTAAYPKVLKTMLGRLPDLTRRERPNGRRKATTFIMSFPLRENWLLRCNRATESDDRKGRAGIQGYAHGPDRKDRNLHRYLVSHSNNPEPNEPPCREQLKGD